MKSIALVLLGCLFTSLVVGQNYISVMRGFDPVSVTNCENGNAYIWGYNENDDNVVEFGLYQWNQDAQEYLSMDISSFTAAIDNDSALELFNGRAGPLFPCINNTLYVVMSGYLNGTASAFMYKVFDSVIDA